MKIWLDDVRPAPEGYIWCKSVNEAKNYIRYFENCVKDAAKYHLWDRVDHYSIELISIDHDAGDFYYDGGDFIRVLDWLEETGRNYPIRIHSMNVVGVQNMLAICRRNGWTVVP